MSSVEFPLEGLGLSFAEVRVSGKVIHESVRFDIRALHGKCVIFKKLVNRKHKIVTIN